MTSNLHKGRHSVTALNAHLVFVTKYRKKLFTQESLSFLHETMKDTAKKMGFNIEEFNGEADHVHLLINYPPKYSISKLVNHLKGVSSRMYRSQYSMQGQHLWSPSYFASSVGGAPIEVLKQYIKEQKSP
ncbi:MAG: IS200/IS605 family transposase [Crocosphaera sp.]|nr:IS200/IS605 family transposase [Crocosphaera sp.]